MPSPPTRAADIAPQPRHSISLAVQPRKASIATASLLDKNGGPSPTGAGPMKKDYIIPPRPKPGRKPATDEPQSKRKQQNRDSQRAFRQRKAAKVAELTGEVENTKQKYQTEIDEQAETIRQLHERINSLVEQHNQLAHECAYWRSHYDTIKQQLDESNGGSSGIRDATSLPDQGLDPNALHSPNDSANNLDGLGSPNALGLCNGCGGPGGCPCFDPPPMDAVPLPPRNAGTAMQGVEMHDPLSNDLLEHEIDFTAKFSKPAVTAFSRDCGFCTDESNCLCRDMSLQTHDNMDIEPVVEEPAQAKMGPGSCEKCQQDPKQREWCQRVAQMRAEPTPPSSRNSTSGTDNVLRPMEPRVSSMIDTYTQKSSPFVGVRSVGCSEAYKLFDGRVPMDAGHQEWQNLRPINPSSGPMDLNRDTFATMQPGTYSAMEVDVGSILTTLQHAAGPLKPRPSDGDNADLIAEAERQRSASEVKPADPK